MVLQSLGWLKTVIEELCELTFYFTFLWAEEADRGNVITLWIKREWELNFSDCSLFSAAYNGIGMAFSAVCYLRRNLNRLLSWNSNSKKKAIQNNKKEIYSKPVNLYVLLFTDYKLAFYKVYTSFFDKISLHKT